MQYQIEELASSLLKEEAGRNERRISQRPDKTTGKGDRAVP